MGPLTLSGLVREGGGGANRRVEPPCLVSAFLAWKGTFICILACTSKKVFMGHPTSAVRYWSQAGEGGQTEQLLYKRKLDSTKADLNA